MNPLRMQSARDDRHKGPNGAATSLLDSVCEQLHTSAADPRLVGTVMDDLVGGLRRLYDQLSVDEWLPFTATARKHPLAHIVHQDPFTRRSFCKPRGYAGDAKLLDYIYGYADDDEPITALGRAIMQYTVNAQAPRAVRQRRDLLAQYIDETVQRSDDVRILSVACGYLREAHLARTEAAAEFIALDQDERSIATASSLFGSKGVRALRCRVRDLLVGRRVEDLGKFDLIYAAGLYEYLSDDVARRLTTTLFGMLRPDGRLLIANFLPNLHDIGYMETFMDWRLLYRTPNDLAAVTVEAFPNIGRRSRVFVDQERAIVFCELSR